MAGDWIKMRSNLWDDPRVARLCDLTDSGEAAVIGGLYWLWAAADQHSTDGVMPGLTLRQIDRKTGVQGLGAALCSVGWLADHPEGARIVNFSDHNGSSAKRRATDAQRKASVRSVSASDADKVQTDEGQNAPDCGARERERDISSSLRSEDIPAQVAQDEKPAKQSRVSITAQQMVSTLPGLTVELANQYLQFRASKRAKLTPAAWSVIATEIVKSGMRPDAALSEAMAAGWQGFKASWLENRNATAKPGGFKTAQEKRAERNAQIFDYEAQMRSLEGM